MLMVTILHVRNDKVRLDQFYLVVPFGCKASCFYLHRASGSRAELLIFDGPKTFPLPRAH